MSILIFIVIVVVVVWLALQLVAALAPRPPLDRVMQAIILLVAIVLIVRRAGLL